MGQKQPIEWVAVQSVKSVAGDREKRQRVRKMSPRPRLNVPHLQDLEFPDAARHLDFSRIALGFTD